MSRSNKRGRTPAPGKKYVETNAPDAKRDASATPNTFLTTETSTYVEPERETYHETPDSIPTQDQSVGCNACDSLLQTNNLAFERLLDEIARLREDIQDCVANKSEQDGDMACGTTSNPEQIDELLWQIRQRDGQLASLERERDSLEQQNQELASKLANQSVRKSVQTSNSSTSDALTWEERKKLILQQMESDSFDTEAFVSNLQSNYASQSQESADGLALDPVAYIEQLCSELERRNIELKSKNDEIGELHCLLEQQGGAREGGLAVGAAAIAQMMDGNELVSEERERLKQLQAEWEEKFRKGEIEASLERAKLSRERQELAKREAELEEQIEHMKRELRLVAEASNSGTGSSRRWLQKLGLGEPRD